MRPGLMGGVAAGLLLVAVIFTGRLMVGLTTPIVSSAPELQSTPTPTKTPIPDLQVSPSSAVLNETVLLTGTNFASSDIPGGLGEGGTHQITGVGDSVITLGGVPLKFPEVQYPVPLTSGGELFVNVVIPVNDTTEPGATLLLKATDTTGKSDSDTVKIKTPTFKINPDEGQGPRGSLVDVTGTGFPASNHRTSVRRVRIDYGSILAVAITETDEQGNFGANFKVPNTARIPSVTTVTATGLDTAITASDVHEVPGPTVRMTPSSGPPGERFESGASGFLGGQQPPGWI